MEEKNYHRMCESGGITAPGRESRSMIGEREKNIHTTAPRPRTNGSQTQKYNRKHTR